MTRFTPRITLFHCLNALGRPDPHQDQGEARECQTEFITMACSSMTRDIYILKAFEAGADAVAVLVCPETACRYAQGSIRARKRVAYVKGILDEIGMGASRLEIFSTKAEGSGRVNDIIQEMAQRIRHLGANPLDSRRNSL